MLTCMLVVLDVEEEILAQHASAAGEIDVNWAGGEHRPGARLNPYVQFR